MIDRHCGYRSLGFVTGAETDAYSDLCILGIDEAIPQQSGAPGDDPGGLLFGLEDTVEASLESSTDVGQVRVVSWRRHRMRSVAVEQHCWFS